MKLFFVSLTVVALTLASGQSFAKMTCASVREKTKSKKGTPSCKLVEHTVGLSRGSSISVYQCGNTKYRLDMAENNDCTVTTIK